MNVNDLKTGPKITGGFVLVAVVIAVVGIVGWSGLSRVVGNQQVLYSEHMVPLQAANAANAAMLKLRGDTYKYLALADDRAATQKSIGADIEACKQHLEEYRKADLTEAEKATADAFERALTQYTSSVDGILAAARDGRTEEALQPLRKGGSANTAREAMGAAVDTLVGRLIADGTELNASSERQSRSALLWVVVITVLGFCAAVALGTLLSRSLTRPLSSVVRMIQEMGKGHLGTRLGLTRRDEIGVVAAEMDAFADHLQRDVLGTLRKIAAGDLSAEPSARDGQDEITPALQATIQSLRGLVAEMARLTDAAVDGRLSTRGEAKRFEGGYREIVAGVNATLDAVIGPLNVAAEYVDRIAKGDIPPRITEAYKGDFNELKGNLNTCIDAVNALILDSKQLAAAAVEGRLASRADATRHQGDFRRIVEGVNATLDAVIGPLNVAAEYIDRISKGDIPPKITEQYRGDFNEIRNNLNVCIESLEGKAQVADAIARGDLSVAVEVASPQDRLGRAMQTMKAAIEALVADTRTLAEAAVDGRLATRADSARHQGDFRTIVAGINATLDAVIGPLNVAAEYVDRISKGDLPPRITERYAGDFNELKNNLNGCIDALSVLIAEMNAMSAHHDAGDIDAVIDATRFHGAYRAMAEGINAMVGGHIAVKTKAMACVAEFGRGNFDAALERFPGKKAFINDTIEQVRSNIKGFIAEMARVSREHEAGDIDVRVAEDRFHGAYREMARGVNEMVDGHVSVKKKAMACVAEFGRGNFEAPLEPFPGKKRFINDTIEQVRANLKSLIRDSSLLSEAALAGKVGTRADASHHQGDYRTIVEGMNRTLDLLTQPIVEVTHAATSLAASSEELTAISQQMAGNAEETASQTGVVSAASDQVSKNLTVVATSSEEMLSSIREIAKSANEAARMAKNAVNVAEATNATVRQLGDSSVQIGAVIKVITSIAEQTNLLALNATIEAARAGDAGKGFAVVANEVKELAKQTADATEDISRRIEAIQGETKGAVQAIGEITGLIRQIDDVSNTIASAVEEQTATTNEIGRNINQAARGAGEIAQNVASVADGAQSTSRGAATTQKAARDLTEMASRLQRLMARFAA